MKQGGGVMMWEKGTRDKWCDTSGGKSENTVFPFYSRCKTLSLFRIYLRNFLQEFQIVLSVLLRIFAQTFNSPIYIVILLYFGYFPEILTPYSTLFFVF